MTIATVAHYMGKPAQLQFKPDPTFAAMYPDSAAALQAIATLDSDDKTHILIIHSGFRFLLDNLFLGNEDKRRATYIARSVAYQLFSQAETYSTYNVFARDVDMKPIGNQRNVRELKRMLSEHQRLYEASISETSASNKLAQERENTRAHNVSNFWFVIGILVASIKPIYEFASGLRQKPDIEVNTGKTS